MRSGRVDPAVTAGTLRLAGQRGYWWSSRASSTRYDGSAIPSAYYLVFDPSAVYPSDGPSDRWYAFPLRRLSTVLDMQSGDGCGGKKTPQGVFLPADYTYALAKWAKARLASAMR